MLEAYRTNFVLDQPVHIATKTLRKNFSSLLILKYGKLQGFGEAVPTSNVTKDTPEAVFQYFRDHANRLPENVSLDAIRQTHRELPAGSPAARAAIDFALHDLWGKIKKARVCDLYDEELNLPPNCITIYGNKRKDTPLVTEDILQTYPHLKVLKVKLLGTDDLERCRLIKETADHLNRSVSYILDCNQAFKTSREAVRILTKIIEMLDEVLLVEEPVPARQWELMKEVSDHLPVPVLADESAVDIEDVYTIIEKKCANGINIKLQKTGGIWPAKEIARLCSENGLDVMLGCMFESSVSIAAGVHFARSTKNVIVTDLDYDLQLPVVYEYGPTFENGVRLPTDYPGLGVKPDFNRMEELKRAGKMIFEKVI